MKFDVEKDRELFIGGSDIPIVMGISLYKTRFDLLLEKAGYKEDDFKGNEYTEYGNKLEPKIRDFINSKYNTNYEPDQRIKGDLRGNTDGFNGESILEIKTTSRIHNKLEDYKTYLVQLLFYMQIYEVEKGYLAVYERPADFNEEFIKDRLTVYDVDLNAFKGLLDSINEAIERFRIDLEKVKANPFIAEEDLQPKDIVEIANKLLPLEQRLTEMKRIESEYKELKQKLYEAMNEHNIKSWTTLNGTKITKIDEIKTTEYKVMAFDETAFKSENKELYSKYLKEETKKKSGRKGYCKITLPWMCHFVSKRTD